MADTLGMPFSLLDAPAQNETLTANVRLIGLPGNTVDVAPYVLYDGGNYNFTLADYGVQFVRTVNTTGKGYMCIFNQQLLAHICASDLLHCSWRGFSCIYRIFEASLFLVSGLNETIPGGLLRFLIVVNVTSDLYPGIYEVMTIKVGQLSS